MGRGLPQAGTTCRAAPGVPAAKGAAGGDGSLTSIPCELARHGGEACGLEGTGAAISDWASWVPATLCGARGHHCCPRIGERPHSEPGEHRLQVPHQCRPPHPAESCSRRREQEGLAEPDGTGCVREAPVDGVLYNRPPSRRCTPALGPQWGMPDRLCAAAAGNRVSGCSRGATRLTQPGRRAPAGQRPAR